MKESRASGPRTIERGLQILRVIALRNDFGWRLTDLAEHCRISPSTAHRLLGCLVRERLVHIRPQDRHYVPGPMLFELGLGLSSYVEFQTFSRPALGRLAKQIGGVAYLMLRSGTDSVCVARGGSPTTGAISADVGTRRPLLSNAGGVAILIRLPAAEMNEVLKQNRSVLRRHGSERLKALEVMLRESMKEGFGLNNGFVVPGMNVLGVATCSPAGRPFASLSIVSPGNPLPRSRQREIVAVLDRESRELALEALRLNLHI